MTTLLPDYTPTTPASLRSHRSVSQVISDIRAMAWRSWLKLLRTPEQFGDVTLQPILFTVMFTYIFGGAISGSISAYMPLIIPGILAQTALQASVSTGVQLREDMEKGVFDRFRAMPISRLAPLAGPVIADLSRYALATVIGVATGLVMGYRPGGGVVGVACAMLLTIFVGWCTSWIFTFLGTVLKSSRGVQGISMLIMFPLTFLSNGMVDPKTMPGWLREFVKINPVTHVIDATRDLMNENTWNVHIVWALVGCLIVVAIFLPLAVWNYSRKV